jgi:hypothetical protein
MRACIICNIEGPTNGDPLVPNEVLYGAEWAQVFRGVALPVALCAQMVRGVFETRDTAWLLFGSYLMSINRIVRLSSAKPT